MAAPMKTPGVYIVEKSAFPNSVVEVATAVPAFIGYTERADNKGKSLLNKPFKITSMAEFHTLVTVRSLFSLYERQKKVRNQISLSVLVLVMMRPSRSM